MRLERIEDGNVGEVTSAGGGKAAVERYAERCTVGVAMLKYLGGTTWRHGMATRWACAYTV
jgi:hypothetical protein